MQILMAICGAPKRRRFKLRHGRTCSGHPRLAYSMLGNEDVDAPQQMRA
jgi:hypothetical protein